MGKSYCMRFFFVGYRRSKTIFKINGPGHVYTCTVQAIYQHFKLLLDKIPTPRNEGTEEGLGETMIDLLS